MKFKNRPSIVDAFRWKVDLTPPWFNYDSVQTNSGEWVISKPGEQIVRTIKEGDYLVKQHNSVISYSPEIFDQFYFSIEAPKAVFYHVDCLENGTNKKTVIEGVEGEEEAIRVKFPLAWAIRTTDSIFDA